MGSDQASSTRAALGTFASKTRQRQPQTYPQTPLRGTDTRRAASPEATIERSQPQPVHPKPSAPTGGPQHPPATASTCPPCRVRPTHVRPSPPVPTHSAIPTRSPVTADPTHVHPIGANPRRGPAARTRGAEGQPPGRGRQGGAWGSPPLPWRQAGARQRSHGCRGRSAPGSRLSWLPALFPLVTTRGPNASPR